MSAHASFEHGIAEVEPGVRLHYVTAGQGTRAVVFLHGFPQTWWAWRHVLPAMAAAGWRAIAVDYRGAGNSSRPNAGYDKRTMAGDVHRLVTEHLGIHEPIALVGHDIGLMVAYAYAQAHGAAVTHLAVLDAPLPGTIVFNRLRSDPRVWQFSFHAVRDLPELLIAGRERLYLQTIFQQRLFDPSAIDEGALATYASAYAAAGAMRAACELYRAFDIDVADNRESLRANGKLAMKVLAMGGAASTTGPLMEEMMCEVASDVRAVRVPRAGHFLPEENPGFAVTQLLEFLG